METLFPAQPLLENHQSAALMSMPVSQPPPQNASDSSHPTAAGSKPHLVYRCALNQLAQKLKKPIPVYQTQNEGSDHNPKFRSTVWVDGVSYTSSNTFQQRKISEMDAAKLAYTTITQKAKTDALDFIREDKFYCKSVLAEFAAKKNIGKPVYETTHIEASVRVFRSNLLFNGGSYAGDIGRSKKEAEQLVARSVIIGYLESEFGDDMAFIVNCKLKQFHEMNKIEEINGGGHGFALTEVGTSTMAESSAAHELSLVQGTMVPSSGVPQPLIPQLSVEPITPVAPGVIQPPTGQVSTELLKPINQIVPVATQLPTSRVSVESIKPAVAEPQVLTPVPSAVVNSSCIPPVSASLVNIPATNLSSNVIQQSMPEASPAPQVSVVSSTPTVVEPLVSTPLPSVVINNSCTPAAPVPSFEIPATNLSSSVIQQPKLETSASQELEYIPLLGQTSDKKRNRKNRKSARKKMRADAQMPVVPASQVLPFSSHH